MKLSSPLNVSTEGSVYPTNWQDVIHWDSCFRLSISENERTNTKFRAVSRFKPGWGGQDGEATLCWGGGGVGACSWIQTYWYRIDFFFLEQPRGFRAPPPHSIRPCLYCTWLTARQPWEAAPDLQYVQQAHYNIISGWPCLFPYLSQVERRWSKDDDEWTLLRPVFLVTKGATISLSGGGGLEDYFSADYFFQLMLKLDFFSYTIWSQIFFPQRIESQTF